VVPGEQLSTPCFCRKGLFVSPACPATSRLHVLGYRPVVADSSILLPMWIPCCDRDPLHRFRQRQANLRILEVTEIRSIPYVPLSHLFVERLVGTIRRECLERTLFWTSADLENKLLDFRTYINNQRTQYCREGRAPDQDPRRPRPVADLICYRWQPYCRGLYQIPIAA
jgi:hypothetical protein